VAVDDTGKNVATTVIYKQDYVIASDGSENSASGYCITDRIDVSANQVYVFSFTRWQAGNTDPIRVGTYKADGTFISRISINNGDTLTVPANCAYVRLSYCNTPNQSTYLYDVQMELGSTATPYEPYAHSSATIQLGQTVYGADINWDTGVGTVTWIDKKVTAVTTMSNRANGDFYGDVDGINDAIPVRNNGVAGQAICNVANNVSADVRYADTNSDIAVRMTGKIDLCIAGIKTKDEMETYLANNDVHICYALATPFTIQLTPEQVQMLKGYNRVTIDNGSIELGYIAKLT
jgi:hypothetical protein